MARARKAYKDMTLERAVRSGYAIVSRSSCWAARIDRPDWQDHMAKDCQDGKRWVESLGVRAGDHYRRCYSRDVIIVPKSWIGMLPNSGDGLTFFVETEPTCK